jgi:hypothetical protein
MKSKIASKIMKRTPKELMDSVRLNTNCFLHSVSNRAEVVSAIVNALRNDEPNHVFKDCPTCKGIGHTYGYGTHSIEPDWCDECGGPGEVVDEDATNLVKQQIVIKVLKEYGC